MKKFKSKINVLLLVFVTIVVLYFSLKDDFSSIVDQIVNINVWYLVIAFLMVIFYWLLRSKAVSIFIKELTRKVS